MPKGLVFYGALQDTVAVQHRMQAKYGYLGKIDEVSILFKSEERLDAFLEWSKTRPRPLEHFNTAIDTNISRYPFPQHRFRVRFEFLRLAGEVNWRIEAMCVLRGRALLHEQKGELSIVHASFKTYSRQDFEETRNALHYRDTPCVGEYINSYGIFSYHLVPGLNIFLKPRVNLRDR